jgi:hypothetical protein
LGRVDFVDVKDARRGSLGAISLETAIAVDARRAGRLAFTGRTRFVCAHEGWRAAPASCLRLQSHKAPRSLGALEPIKDESLTSLEERPIKIGAKGMSRVCDGASNWPTSSSPRNLFPAFSAYCGIAARRRPRQQRNQVKFVARATSWRQKFRHPRRDRELAHSPCKLVDNSRQSRSDISVLSRRFDGRNLSCARAVILRMSTKISPESR